MDESAFIAGLPALFSPFRNNSPNLPGARPNRSPAVRATASTPDRPSDEGNDNSLEQSRAAMERMLSLNIEPKSEGGGQCCCIWCSGTKERKCSWCDGKGVRHEFVNKSWDQIAMDIEKMQSGDGPQFMEAPEKVPVRCSACSGSKKLRCAYCRGSGVGSYGHAY